MGNKTRFTPGPWVMNVWTTGRRTVECRTGLVLAEVHVTHEAPEQDANARLISAAPEMYAQLVKMRDGMNCVCNINKVVAQLGAGIECTVCAINAILAKAVRP